MDKKRIAQYVPYAIAALCVVAILAMGNRTLGVYKGRNEGLFKTLEDQKKNIAEQQKTIDQQNKVIQQLNKNAEQQVKNINQVVTERNNAIASLATCTQAPASPSANPEQEAEVKDILEPATEATDDNPTQMDAMKKRYEEMLVTYFLLKKCGRVKATDYHVITSALSQEMASVDAPGRLQADILTSAQGSFQELYSNSPCDDDTILPLEVQYNAFIDSVTQRYTPQTAPQPDAAQPVAQQPAPAPTTPRSATPGK